MSNAFRFFILLCCLSVQVAWGTLFFQAPILATTAPSLPELQQQQQQIEQYRSSVKNAKQRLEQQEQSTHDRINGLQQKIDVTASQIDLHQDKLAVATDKLKQIKKELSQIEAQYGRQKTSTVARLRFLQRQGDVPGWTALLESHSIDELLSRQYQMKRVYEADSKSLVALKKSKDDIEAKRIEAETQRNQIALIKQQLVTQKSSFEEQAQSEKILVNRLKSDREALTAAEQQLVQESAKISENIQLRLAARIAFPNIQFLPGTGQMQVPADGPITSIFGIRIHPILGTARFHNGLDFGAEYGSLIRAADNGVVISAGWTGGYGNAVIIDHGNGISTLYGHTSQIFVTLGQVVQKGQPIAAVGSTGLSTGPHLHFEVRQAGEPVDPVPFLKG